MRWHDGRNMVQEVIGKIGIVVHCAVSLTQK
jgi:hypothetical protein